MVQSQVSRREEVIALCGMMANTTTNNNKRPLTPKSMPPAGDEHAKPKT